jgi:hypothetical protein
MRKEECPLMATKKVGFVKQYRAIMNSSLWHEDSKKLKVYQTIFLMVNWQANRWTFKGDEYNLTAGQTVTSYGNIAKDAGSKDITYKVVRNACKWLHDEGYICLETQPKKSIMVTVLDWEETQNLNAIDDIQRNKQIVSSEWAHKEAQEWAQESDDFIEAETSMDKGFPALSNQIGAQNRAQDGAQDGALIEELKEIKEKEASNASIGNKKEDHEKEEAADASPLKWILDTYYQLYKEYNKCDADVNYKRDLHRLNTSENKTFITTDSEEKVTNKLRGWFYYEDDWKIRNKYPFAAFLKQYPSVRESYPDKPTRYLLDTCPECHRGIYKNEEHICTHIFFCEKCNCAMEYKGKKEDFDINKHHKCDPENLQYMQQYDKKA